MNNYKEMSNSITDSTTYCKCGHSIVMLPTTAKGICSHCGRMVNNTAKTRFRFELFKRMNEGKNDCINYITNNELND